MQKETYEWVHSWCDQTQKNDLPRVLLIGDSITFGYQEEVRKLLEGVCYVDYFTTSYAIDDKIYTLLLDNFIKDSNYALLHFNHGLHGMHMSVNTYRSKIEKFLAKVAKDKKVILAETTAVNKPGNRRRDTVWMKKVIARNEVINMLSEKLGYPVDRLYDVSAELPVSVRAEDGTHYQKAGNEALAACVAESIKAELGR
ncbi:MAG: SGNH/GDSL hydrolase family protein [Clostridia bacterium]|nr:SGNH/GDSL hydrolase family protein [Clostridia bacterium]